MLAIVAHQYQFILNGSYTNFPAKYVIASFLKHLPARGFVVFCMAHLAGKMVLRQSEGQIHRLPVCPFFGVVPFLWRNVLHTRK